MDIKNLKEVIDLALTGVEIVGKAKQDGKIDAADLGLLLQLVPVLSPAIDGIGEIPAELANLDAQEAQELVAHVMAKLVIKDPKAVAIVGASLKMATGGLELYRALQSKESE